MSITTLEAAQMGTTMNHAYDPYDRARFRTILNTGELDDYNRNHLKGCLTVLPYEAQDEILNRVQLIENFAYFQEAVDQLLTEIEEYGSPAEHPNYLTSGGWSDVFGIEIDGKLYAMRRDNQCAENRSAYIEVYVPPLMRGFGNPNLEQLMSYDYKRGVVISEMLMAAEIQKVAHPNVCWLRAESVSQLFTDLEDMEQRYITVDTINFNLLMAADGGIKIVDYELGYEDAQTMAMNCLRQLFRIFTDRYHKSAGGVIPAQATELRAIADEYGKRFNHPSFAEAMHKAIDELPTSEWFIGYSL